jgi:hypothetical protein
MPTEDTVVPGNVADACNLGYLGDRGRRIMSEGSPNKED